jgi:iron complex outermembrane receptor protein
MVNAAPRFGSITRINRVPPSSDSRPARQVSLLLLVSIAGSSLAYGATGDETKIVATSNIDQIQEIVVTAQFQRQDLQRIPLAITAVTSAMIEARGSQNIMDVANTAPGITFSSGGVGGAQSTFINIRGIGQTDFNMAVEPGVGMYIDDVYYGTIYGSMLELLDLDHVEVLRGPQGTLSGKDSEGGAVKLYSKQPSDAGGGYLDATFGSYQRRLFRAGDNFTLIPDKLFMRLSGLSEKSDGYVTRYDYQCETGNAIPGISEGSAEHGGTSGCKLGTEGGRDSTALRAAVRYLATDHIEDTFSYDTTIDHSEASPTVLIDQGTWHGPGYNLLVNPPVLNLAPNFVPPAGSYYNYSTYTGLAGTPNQYTLPAKSDLNAWGVANVLDVELANSMRLKWISSLRNLKTESVADGDASPFSRQLNLWNVDYRQHTEELRLSGHYGGLLDWTVGGYYFKSDALQGGRFNLDGAGDNGVPFFTTFDFFSNDPVHVKSKSGFLHTELHATDKLTFTAGTRYTDDSKRYDYSRTIAPGYAPSIIDESVLPLNGASGAFQGSRWDYRFTASYQLTQDMNVYGQVSTGFKGGGVNPRPFYIEQVRSFKPETVDSYEVGLKTDLLDRHARVNLAAFYNKYKDMQLALTECPQYVPAGAPQNCLLPDNVGDSIIKGAELEAELHPIDNLLMDLSASYLNFHYTKVDTVDTGIGRSDTVPFTPRWKFDAGLQYKIDIGAGSITPRIDYRYQAQVYATAVNYPLSRIPSYGLTNARLTYRDASGNWELAAEGTNLTNKYYYTNVNNSSPPASNSFQFTSVNPGRPREFAMTFKRNF